MSNIPADCEAMARALAAAYSDEELECVEEFLSVRTQWCQVAAQVLSWRDAWRREARAQALEEAAALGESVYMDLIANSGPCPCGNGRIPTRAYDAATHAYTKAIRVSAVTESATSR